MIAVTAGPLSRLERFGLVLSLVAAATLTGLMHDQLNDSVFVGLRFARHLAEGRGLVYNLDERVYGSASPLWVTLVADGIALGIDGLAVARALSVAATLASVGLFLQLTRRLLRSPLLRVLATLAWSCNAWMAQWAASGLETPLAVALVLAGFVALTEGPEWGDRPVRTGALWTLAALTRPGAVFLVALWCTALLIDAHSRPGLRRLVFGVAPVVSIYGGWLLFVRLYYGTFWPQVLSLHPGTETMEQTLLGIGRQVQWAWVGDGALIVAFVAAAVFGGARLWPAQKQARRLLPWAWVVLLPALLAARDVPVESRHLLLVLPIAHVLVWRAVEVWWSGPHPPPPPHTSLRVAFLGGALAVLVALPNLEVVRSRVVPAVQAATRPIREQLLPWGRRLAGHHDRDPIATSLVGAVGWSSGRPILDLTGQMSPRVLELRQSVGERAMVEDLAFGRVARAPHLIVRADAESALVHGRYRDAVTVLDRGGGLALLELDWSRVDRVNASTVAAP